MTMTDWIQAIATIILVGITAFYALQTLKTVNEMKKQRYTTFRPVIDICRNQADEDKMPEAICY